MQPEAKRYGKNITQAVISEPRAMKLTLPVLSEVALSQVILFCALASGIFLRIWQLNAMGYNTDEAVYAGQSAAIAGVPVLKDIFPVFRAHPLLFQFTLSLVFRLQFNDLYGRLLSVSLGVATIYVTYRTGKLLYGPLGGAWAAVFLALMPYHVLVSRQVLLDGPMVFFTTLTLYMLALFGKTHKIEWLLATGAALGLAILSKETAIILLGAIYVFLALSPEVRVRIQSVIAATLLLVAVFAPFPISIFLAGGSSAGKNYLTWQLFRPPNHEWPFYLETVPFAMGIFLVATAVTGFVVLWREHSWREKLLIAWVIVPIVFFQFWPVKGFQYLLPTAPPMAILAARLVSNMMSEANTRATKHPRIRYMASWLVASIIVASLGWVSWQRIQPAISSLFLAGTGGVPGGREAGTWVLKNVPESAHFMTIGPSMANIIQFYGGRKAYGLAVSPNPLHRNPSYEPIINPDLQIRQSNLQYLVWDSFSAARSKLFADKLLSYVNKYNGRAIHTEYITVQDENGKEVVQPVIIIYEVHP